MVLFQWRIQGGTRHASPLRTKISLISWGFSENIIKILDRRPPRDWRPLLGEVLVSPLAVYRYAVKRFKCVADKNGLKNATCKHRLKNCWTTENMAAGNVKDLTNCPVCSEPDTITGENIPKILPCTCAKCTTKKSWRRQSYLKCPQCGELCIFKGVEFIWDNTYILAHLMSKSNHQQEVKLHCQERGREIILYCDSCHICLCFLCTRTKHQECDIFGIREEKLTEILFEKVSCLRKTLGCARFQVFSQLFLQTVQILKRCSFPIALQTVQNLPNRAQLTSSNYSGVWILWK